MGITPKLLNSSGFVYSDLGLSRRESKALDWIVLLHSCFYITGEGGLSDLDVTGVVRCDIVLGMGRVEREETGSPYWGVGSFWRTEWFPLALWGHIRYPCWHLPQQMWLRSPYRRLAGWCPGNQSLRTLCTPRSLGKPYPEIRAAFHVKALLFSWSWEWERGVRDQAA